MVHPYLESWVPSFPYASQKYFEIELFPLRMGVTTCKCEGRNIKKLMISSKYVKLGTKTQYFFGRRK
jgi:hypothetical protein